MSDLKPGMRVLWQTWRNGTWPVAQSAVVLGMTERRVSILYQDKRVGIRSTTVLPQNIIYPRPPGTFSTPFLDAEADKLIGGQYANG